MAKVFQGRNNVTPAVVRGKPKALDFVILEQAGKVKVKMKMKVLLVFVITDENGSHCWMSPCEKDEYLKYTDP